MCVRRVLCEKTAEKKAKTEESEETAKAGKTEKRAKITKTEESVPQQGGQNGENYV